jgi:perosamine synthetase
LKHIYVSAPDFGPEERSNLINAFDSEWISGSGAYVNEFEEVLESLVEAPVTVVANGTCALHLLLSDAGVSQGDEVIVPSLTFVSTANAVLYCGATPRFADCDPKTWNVSLETIKPLINSNTKAVVVTHLFGQPVDIDPIYEYVSKFGIKVYEDAAEAIGGRYKGKPIGNLADGAIFSFFANKTITCGEGGAIVSVSNDHKQRMQFLRSQGMSSKRFYHTVLGYNYRLTNIQAAIGVAQAKKIEALIKKREKIFQLYDSLLPASCTPQENLQDGVSGKWIYGIVLPHGSNATKIAAIMLGLGIETRPFFIPLNEMPYIQTDDPTPIAKSVAEFGLCLPTHGKLLKEDIVYIVDSLKDALIA